MIGLLFFFQIQSIPMSKFESEESLVIPFILISKCSVRNHLYTWESNRWQHEKVSSHSARTLETPSYLTDFFSGTPQIFRISASLKILRKDDRHTWDRQR